MRREKPLGLHYAALAGVGKLVAPPPGQMLVTAKAQTSGEQNAMMAVNQFLTLKLSQPSGAVPK
jgi:hypothetical protein